MILALEELSKVYVRRSVLNLEHAQRYLEVAVLESLRLRWLHEGRFIGAKVELMHEAICDDFRIADDLPRIFGKAPLVMFEEILSKYLALPARPAITSLFRTIWEARIHRDLNWRLAGRPSAVVG